MGTSPIPPSEKWLALAQETREAIERARSLQHQARNIRHWSGLLRSLLNLRHRTS